MSTEGHVAEAHTGVVRLAPDEGYSWTAQQFLDGTGRTIERRRIIGRLGWQRVTWTESEVLSQDEMSTETAARDYEGNPLTEGAHVTAWCKEGQPYTATVKDIGPRHPGAGDFRRIVLVRDEDDAEVEDYSDAVVVIAR